MTDTPTVFPSYEPPQGIPTTNAHKPLFKAIKAHLKPKAKAPRHVRSRKKKEAFN